MPSKDGFSTSPTTYDSPDGLYLNPFSDNVDHKPFTSALEASASRHTVVPRRRRGSDGFHGDGSKYTSHSRSRTLDDVSDGARHLRRSSSSRTAESSAHSRSRTMDDDADAAHPLRRSSSAKSWRSYVGNTRPHLSRMLSSHDDPPVEDVLDDPESETGQKEVMIHEIDRHDSLAGVALKYGITITDLRRANQLWASDSIHLRKHLYIPVEKARHPRLGLASSSQEHGLSTTGSSPAAIDSPVKPDHSPIYPVHKVPAIRLSYFPPSSTTSFAEPSSSRQHRGITSSTPSSFSDFPASDYQPPPATMSRASTSSSLLRAGPLSSLFSVLPIAASTRDELMSRLSVESASTSTTGTASDEEELEMNAVPTTPKSRQKLTHPATVVSPHHLPTSILPHLKAKRKPSGEQIALASNPIRTVQMQPAPLMQLPEHISRSSSKTSVDANVAWRAAEFR
ncbi:hypothetical protein BV25DRAFT_1912831 [Artomyces pyxidatus]|uniref:Uncharacterized protein n=1 Tax=Artomyces pyxidatus TaxID=48021 RepID=A0ACB8TCQ0_9AGAM|nr:hypothetical protein BV25DRAFT_1912831 [Artomyces pyxidatus]